MITSTGPPGDSVMPADTRALSLSLRATRNWCSSSSFASCCESSRPPSAARCFSPAIWRSFFSSLRRSLTAVACSSERPEVESGDEDGDVETPELFCRGRARPATAAADRAALLEASESTLPPLPARLAMIWVTVGGPSSHGSRKRRPYCHGSTKYDGATLREGRGPQVEVGARCHKQAARGRSARAEPGAGGGGLERGAGAATRLAREWPEQALTHGAGRPSGAPRLRPRFPIGCTPARQRCPGVASRSLSPVASQQRDHSSRRMHAGKPLSSAAASAARRGMGAVPGPQLLSSESSACVRVLGARARHRAGAWAGGRTIEHLGALASVDNSRRRLVRRRLGPPVPHVARGRSRYKVTVVAVPVRVHDKWSTVQFPTAFSAGARRRDVIRRMASDLPLPELAGCS